MINTEKLRTKNESGVFQLVIIVVLVVGILVLSAVSYYVLKSQGKAPVALVPNISQLGPISASTDTNTIETELNDTQIDSIDSDLKDLDASAAAF